MLEIEGLEVNYQNFFRALRGVSLEVREGDLTALIGSNGAGKTTLLNAISGLLPVTGGRMSWQGTDVTGLSPDLICRLGIVQVPEGRKLFPNMTVLENLEMGAYLTAARSKAAESFKMVFDLFPRLAERCKQAAGSLSGGEQQMLAVGRALMARPRLLMLDEPSLGLAPIVASEIFQIIGELNRNGLTVLLVSQEVLYALSIAKYCYLMESGKIILHGPGDQILADPTVKSHYLGL
ncbi:MAG: ABC transporter ATP-binding protein [Desulfomonile tiedjei]|uniref:ABC transporter ATP-binding protein n=1 Tax=Desulfomonile tiedjei TaxID=2358 RepID=A0A9D6Z1J9_9BACT|nr:ABC transporter ATP-binding protein [Desulfomonile tiedjei]